MTSSRRLLGARLVLGVCGSIAAYKAAGLLRALTKEGADVTVVMTEAATRFVTPLTFEALSKHPVALDFFSSQQTMLHLTLPESADAIVVAPATANCLAKAALGLADDLLSTLLLNAARCPLILAPAMDGGMWDHSAVRGHVETLRRRGVIVLDPEDGPLASGKVGLGRLVEESAILQAVGSALRPVRDYTGQRVLVSAGPTQEAIDPVRFMSNRSSGKMGYALARVASERGADVVLVSGPTALEPVPGVELVSVRTAEEMLKAMSSRFDWATVVIMAAAVADFRLVKPAARKIKKTQQPSTMHLELERTEDILETLGRRKTRQCLVGFAAETDDVVAHAREKLARKHLDVIVANDVSREGIGFESDDNAAILLDRNGGATELALMTKREMAGRILDAVAALRAESSSQAPEHPALRRRRAGPQS
jgi:phosphopantothenoylcysteine decarboxylase/phosphopantothenate--cysteine ligase